MHEEAASHHAKGKRARGRAGRELFSLETVSLDAVGYRDLCIADTAGVGLMAYRLVADNRTAKSGLVWNDALQLKG